jgi:branched-subunit amino acid aminotransferase/4-amino-4-deoxychorismate lyase
VSEPRLYAVHGGDLTRLPVPPGARDLHDLFHDLGAVNGIYSALRTYQGNRFVRLPEHIARCQRCVEAAGWKTRFAFGGLARALHEAVTGPESKANTTEDVRVRFDLFERPIEIQGTTTQVLLGLAPHQPISAEILRDGVQLDFAPQGLGRPVPLIKFTEWVSARRVCQTKSPDAYEHLLLDAKGNILEGTSSNFYAVRGGTLITAVDQVLEGITRGLVLELAEGSGLVIEGRSPSPEELRTVDEAFITSATRELVAVTDVAGIRIGAGKPGPIVAALLRDYQSYVATHAAPAIPFPAT